MLELLNHFTSLTEVRIAFFSLGGEELCIVRTRSICGYCSLPIGYAMIGQFRLPGAPADSRSERGFRALEKRPRFTLRKVEDLPSMFRVAIEHMANQSLVGRRDFDLLGPLAERMRGDPSEAPMLAEAEKFGGWVPRGFRSYLPR